MKTGDVKCTPNFRNAINNTKLISALQTNGFRNTIQVQKKFRITRKILNSVIQILKSEKSDSKVTSNEELDHSFIFNEILNSKIALITGAGVSNTIPNLKLDKDKYNFAHSVNGFFSQYEQWIKIHADFIKLAQCAPTPTFHLWLKEFCARKNIIYYATQNIDGFEEIIKLKDVVDTSYIHGNINTTICLSGNHVSALTPKVLGLWADSRGAPCHDCILENEMSGHARAARTANARLRPNIILKGLGLDDYTQSFTIPPETEYLLIVGTSLRIAGLNDFISAQKERHEFKIVLTINFRYILILHQKAFRLLWTTR